MYSSIRTYSGVDVKLPEITTEHIKIEDIAHSLAYQCRFTGHTDKFYSVAEHSINLSLMVPQLYRPYVLLHDAHETYYGDLNSPFKSILRANWPGYDEIIETCDKAIISAMGLDWKKFAYCKQIAKDVEAELLNLEIAVLLHRKAVRLPPDHVLNGSPFGMPPDEAEVTFKAVFQRSMA